MQHSVALYSMNLLLTSYVLHFGYLTKAQEDSYFYCNTATNYTYSSDFQQNLNLTLSSLDANASLSGYYVAATGEIPDAAYALIQCRGYVSMTYCLACSTTAVSKITQLCRNQKEAFIIYENCSLQYSDWRFFSSVDNYPRLLMFNTQNVTDTVLFNSQLGYLLRNISSNAADDASRLAVGNVSYADFHTIFAMVQCTIDIKGSDCLSCLQIIISYIPKSILYNKVGGRIFALSCNFRYETYSFPKFESTAASPPPPSVLLEPNSTTTTSTTRDSTSQDGKNSKTIVIVVAALGVVFALVLNLCGCFFWKKAKRKRPDDDDDDKESLSIGLNILREATGNFSDAYKLGEGGFGPVYKGKLTDGREIAVKRLARKSGQGLEELKTEVMLVAKLLHRNLVRLLGFCLDKEEKLLVYEYLPNGSLDKVLFDEKRRFTLQWERRYKIIVGIARGLLYLHKDSQLRIIHRDLKASNILLDEYMNPKISDFGLAKLFSGSQTHGNTNRIAGTYGYMAPEYAKNGHFSTKSDVYSFGIMVLEIVSGQKNSGFRNFTNLQSHAWEHWTNGTALEMVDTTIGDEWPKYQVIECIHIGLLCVQEAVIDRPSISDVVMMLSGNYTTAYPAPMKPAYFVSRGGGTTLHDSVVSQLHGSKLESSHQSVNEASITELHPR